jgi:hypothetical protein
VPSQHALAGEFAMIPALITLPLLAGAIFGMRYKILILVPAVGSVLVIVFAGGLARGDSVAATMLATMLASACLQIGYLCGALMRQTVFKPGATALRKLALGSETD